MAGLTKKQMRALPTLTEVVKVPSAAHTASASQPDTVDVDLIVERVMKRLDLSLPAYIRDVVESLVLAHIQEVEPRLKQKVAIAVRQAVAKTVATVIREQGLQPDSGLDS
jgi:hypothetical protein